MHIFPTAEMPSTHTNTRKKNVGCPQVGTSSSLLYGPPMQLLLYLERFTVSYMDIPSNFL